jgi:hypothetical protein
MATGHASAIADECPNLRDDLRNLPLPCHARQINVLSTELEVDRRQPSDEPLAKPSG